jgi:hypothetical protein
MSTAQILLILHTSSEIDFNYEKKKSAEKWDFIVRNAADGAEIIAGYGLVLFAELRGAQKEKKAEC